MAINNEISYKAGGTIAPCRFVKPDTSADEQVIQATSASDICGISPEYQRGTPGLAGSDTAICAISGDSIRVVGEGNDCLLTIGSGGCTAGDLLGSDTDGKGVTVANGAGTKVGARALQTVNAGAKCRVVRFGTRIA